MKQVRLQGSIYTKCRYAGGAKPQAAARPPGEFAGSRPAYDPFSRYAAASSIVGKPSMVVST
jgi:hypothetical protein